MTWRECIDKGHVKKSFIDRQRAKSLAGLSGMKLKFVSGIEVNDDNAPILFVEAYDSLLELCQAIACLEGYKILNHECLKHLLEKLGLSAMAERFDRFRKIRNKINYYGKRVDAGFTRISIREMRGTVSGLKDFMKGRYPDAL